MEHRLRRGSPALALLLCALVPLSAARAQVLHQYSLDQQIRSPAPTIGIRFSLTQPMGWTISSMTINVDGTDHSATVASDHLSGSIQWDSSQAENPSEHFAYAIAHVTSPYIPPYAKDIDSRSQANGDGWAADFIIAAMKLKSLEYGNDVDLANSTNSPVQTPQLTWSEAGQQTRANPFACIRNTYPTNTIGDWSHGSATTGITLSVTASYRDPALTLYQTNGVLQCEFPLTLTAQNPLDDWVARYQMSLTAQLYVKFTRTQNWSPASGYYNTYSHWLYGLLSSPTAPMTTPWVGVLDRACVWAQYDTDATAAANHLTACEYNNCTYNNGRVAHVDWLSMSNAGETFHLLGFLTGSDGKNSMWGECEDFADFLVCLSNAIGARGVQSQRSADWDDVLHAATWPGAAMFQTNQITAAPTQGAGGSQVNWRYHQWTNNGTIFDGSLRFGGTVTPADMDGPGAASTYYNGLVSQLYPRPVWYDPNWLWRPWNPQNPFVPTIVD